MHNKESVAIGTILSALFWWLLCVLDFKEINYRVKDIAFMIIELVTFNICGLAFNSIVGCVIYLLFTLTMTVMFSLNDLVELIKLGTKVLIRHSGKKYP